MNVEQKRQVKQYIIVGNFFEGSLIGPQFKHSPVIPRHSGGHTFPAKLENPMSVTKNSTALNYIITMKDESKFQQNIENIYFDELL